MIYDTMSLSKTYYEESLFRDPLTFDLGNFNPVDNIIEYYLTQADIMRPDIFFYNIYESNDYDELVLWINKKASVYELKVGEIFLIPTPDDLEIFFVKNVK